MNTQYEAVVHRDNRWWIIEIPQIAALTRSRRLSEAREAARNCIAATTKAAPADVDVVISDIQVLGPGGIVRHLLNETTQVRETQRKLEEAAASVVRDFVTDLTTENCRIPVRDIAHLMGLTAGRISQLSKRNQSAEPPRTATPGRPGAPADSPQ